MLAVGLCIFKFILNECMVCYSLRLIYREYKATEVQRSAPLSIWHRGGADVKDRLSQPRTDTLLRHPVWPVCIRKHKVSKQIPVSYYGIGRYPGKDSTRLG